MTHRPNDRWAAQEEHAFALLLGRPLDSGDDFEIYMYVGDPPDTDQPLVVGQETDGRLVPYEEAGPDAVPLGLFIPSKNDGTLLAALREVLESAHHERVSREELEEDEEDDEEEEVDDDPGDDGRGLTEIRDAQLRRDVLWMRDGALRMVTDAARSRYFKQLSVVVPGRTFVLAWEPTEDQVDTGHVIVRRSPR